MPRAPGIELLHGLRKQCSGDTSLLKIRTHSQWTEEADASPIGGKIGAD